MRIAFTGNPNCGKTTVYNRLTGRREKVGNWAGVTVDRKEAPILRAYSGSAALTAVDLPGTYSLSAFTGEEQITGDFIRSAQCDVIVNIVDASHLRRSLFLTTQLLELGIPVVVALNKMDVIRKQGMTVDAAKLSQRLGCPVVTTAATSGEGLERLVQTAVRSGKTPQKPHGKHDTDQQRFAYAAGIVQEAAHRKAVGCGRNPQDLLDRFLTHPIVGLLVFAGVMLLVLQISQVWVGSRIADLLAGGMDRFRQWASTQLAGENPFFAALLTEGIIGGVSAVMGFVPLVAVMYFLLSLLEDCGYMARATVVLDPICKKVGLSGKAVIPFLLGTGCAVPGIMACRTLRDGYERSTAAMLTPFMPCGAKLPMIALFTGAFFPDAAWVGLLMYFVGVGVILLCGLLIRHITGRKHCQSYFLIELPAYQWPSVKKAAVDAWERSKAFAAKAGSIVLLCNVIVFIMQSFDWKLRLVAVGMPQTSILATVADPVAAILVPVIGIRSWQMAAATITGYFAKENVVGTLAACYGLSGSEGILGAAFGISKAAALAFLMLNLFSPPCFAAIGAMRAEIPDKKWFWGGIFLQLGVGYTLAFLVYQFGTLLTDGAFGTGFAVGLAMVGAAAVTAIVLCMGGKRENPEKPCICDKQGIK